jgi:hypothetical protein
MTDTWDDEDTKSDSTETKNFGFYNPHDGIKGRDGGPYLDYVEREQAEKIRAQAEGREPVFDGSTPATAGTPLVPATQLTDNSFNSNPSRRNAPGFEVAVSDDTFADGDFLADPVSVLPVSVGTEASEDVLDATDNGGPSASPGAEFERGDADPDDYVPANPESVGTES